MDPLPSLSESDVRHRVGPAAFERARPYVRSGALSDARRQGRTLRAECRGTLPEPYRLRVTFDADGVAEADCSCPVGDGGCCKHVAALLLTWLRDPDAFAETEPVERMLEQRGRDDLVELIRRMVERHPDLEALVAMPPPGSAALAAGVAERQVRRILSAHDDEWGGDARVGRDLEGLVRQAGGYARHGDWASAHAVCRAVIEGVLGDDLLNDESGTVADVVNECVEALGQCLEHATDPELRADVAGLLYDVLKGDAELGGIGLGDEAQSLLVAHATAAERAGLCVRIEADLRRIGASDDWSRGWRRKTLGGLLLALQPGAADDETYLRVCRASGRTEDLVARLLSLNRLDEALDAARAASDHDLLPLLPRFADHDHGDAAEALVLGRLGDDPDRRLVAWVRDRARDRGDAARAQPLAERLFWAAPSAEGYADVLALSRALGREDAARDALRTRLRAEKAYAVLTQAYLHDGEPDEALQLVHLPAKEWPWPAERDRLRLVVAEAVAGSHPEEALGLILDAAVALVERRGRGHYAEAARLLKTARGIYRQRGTPDDWTLFVGEFRDAYKGLPALRDEMRRAGL